MKLPRLSTVSRSVVIIIVVIIVVIVIVVVVIVVYVIEQLHSNAKQTFDKRQKWKNCKWLFHTT